MLLAQIIASFCSHKVTGVGKAIYIPDNDKVKPLSEPLLLVGDKQRLDVKSIPSSAKMLAASETQ